MSDFIHESFCDTQNNISKTCNCIIGYPLEVIEKLQERERKLKEALESITEEWSGHACRELIRETLKEVYGEEK